MVVDGTQTTVDETISDSKCDKEYVLVDEAIGTVDFEVKESENGTVVINEDVVGGVEVIIVVIDKEISDFTGTSVVIVIDVIDKDVIFDEEESPVLVAVAI